MRLGDVIAYGCERPARTLSGAVRLELRPELLSCDLCGRQAVAASFASDGASYPAPRAPVRALFACRRHSHGGYEIDLGQLAESGTISHLVSKRWGIHAVAALRDRLEAADDEALWSWLERRAEEAA